MKVIDVTDTAKSLTVTHRTLPAGMRVLFFTAALGFLGFVLANVDLSNSTWLPPFDRLPPTAKFALQFLCIGAGIAVLIWPIAKGLRILLWGEVWEFEAKRQLVTRNGRVVLSFGEIRNLRIEGDTRDEPSTVTLSIATRAGRRIEIAQGTLHRQLEHFADVAHRVHARMQIPYETVGIPADDPPG
jgi:hypothetical protein